MTRLKADARWSKVDNVHRAISTLSYRHPAGERAQAEVKTFAGLRDVMRRNRHLAAPQRLDFYFVLYVRRGNLMRQLDFASQRLRAGEVTLARPAQVQRLQIGPAVEGTAMLFVPAAAGTEREVRALLDPFEGFERGRLRDGAKDRFERALAALADACAALDDGAASLARIRLQTGATLLTLAASLERAEPAGPADALFVDFAKLVEKRYAEMRDANAYAAELGCSPRTLWRAIRRARGQSAKAYIDARILLEAKRRLGFGDAPLATIASDLGFSEPTNFTKFFTRLEGCSPSSFRSRHGLSVTGPWQRLPQP